MNNLLNSNAQAPEPGGFNASAWMKRSRAILKETAPRSAKNDFYTTMHAEAQSILNTHRVAPTENTQEEVAIATATLQAYAEHLGPTYNKEVVREAFEFCETVLENEVDPAQQLDTLQRMETLVECAPEGTLQNTLRESLDTHTEALCEAAVDMNDAHTLRHGLRVTQRNAANWHEGMHESHTDGVRAHYAAHVATLAELSGAQGLSKADEQTFATEVILYGQRVPMHEMGMEAIAPVAEVPEVTEAPERAAPSNIIHAEDAFGTPRDAAAVGEEMQAAQIDDEWNIGNAA